MSAGKRLYELKVKCRYNKYSSLYVWCHEQSEGIEFMRKALPKLKEKFAMMWELPAWSSENEWLHEYFLDKPRGFINTTGLPVHALGFEVLACPFVWCPTREEKIGLLLGNE